MAEAVQTKMQFACIVDRSLNLLVGETTEHREIIKRFKLQDDRIRNRDFVRLSLVEVNGRLMYGVDEKATLPYWFLENQNLIYKKARCAYYERKENKNMCVDNI